MNYVKKNRNSYFVVCSERLFPVLVGVIKLQYFSSGKFDIFMLTVHTRIMYTRIQICVSVQKSHIVSLVFIIHKYLKKGTIHLCKLSFPEKTAI